jgi:transcriptional regulator with XRE-family HTH domain
MCKTMSNQEIIAKNIRVLRIGKGLTQENLSDQLDLSSSQYSNYEQGTRAVPIEVLAKISAFYQIAIDAIVKYDISKVDIKGLMKVGENRLLFPIFITENGRYESVEIVPIKASAGYLRGYADPEFLEGLSKMDLPFLGPGTYRAFQIEGDSMLPIPSGSYIIGRFIESLSQVRNGKSYVVITHEGITYKKVMFHTDMTLSLIPYNQYYKTVTISSDDLLEIWEYQCYLSTKEYREEDLLSENFLPVLKNIGSDIELIKNHITTNK